MNNQSFSGKVKDELCRLPMEKSCCMMAELCALTQTSGQLQFRGGGRVQVSFSVESAALAKRIFILLKKRLRITPRIHYVEHSRFGGRRECILTLGDTDSQILLFAMNMAEKNSDGTFSLTHTTPRLPITRQCCRRAFVRGTFLGCGTMTSPEKGYHMEWTTDSEKLAETIGKTLETSDIQPSMYLREGNTVVYLKSGDKISAALAMMGAGTSMMEMENVRITREARQQANRARNCDEANGDKTAAAALEQIAAIKVIDEKQRISTLPAPLREVAAARLENPDATIQELGEMMVPPIGKSGVSHRMKKITDMAQKVKEEEKQKQEENNGHNESAE